MYSKQKITMDTNSKFSKKAEYLLSRFDSDSITIAIKFRIIV